MRLPEQKKEIKEQKARVDASKLYWQRMLDECHLSAAGVAEIVPASAPVLVNLAKTRYIIEYCCGEDSLLGKLVPPDCVVFRITKAVDHTTSQGEMFSRALCLHILLDFYGPRFPALLVVDGAA